MAPELISPPFVTNDAPPLLPRVDVPVEKVILPESPKSPLVRVSKSMSPL